MKCMPGKKGNLCVRLKGQVAYLTRRPNLCEYQYRGLFRGGSEAMCYVEVLQYCYVEISVNCYVELWALQLCAMCKSLPMLDAMWNELYVEDKNRCRAK